MENSPGKFISQLILTQMQRQALPASVQPPELRVLWVCEWQDIQSRAEDSPASIPQWVCTEREFPPNCSGDNEAQDFGSSGNDSP